jgi:ElaB/YqjD/DUF883 family membrane-anchored ribosome-binding protein
MEDHIMSNHPVPGDEMGHNSQDDQLSGTRGFAGTGAEPSFREKAQEYLGGRRVQEFADAAAEQVTEATDYLRNTYAQRMRADVERLVKSNPGPAILIAATFGFLLGRTLHRN